MIDPMIAVTQRKEQMMQEYQKALDIFEKQIHNLFPGHPDLYRAKKLSMKFLLASIEEDNEG